MKEQNLVDPSTPEEEFNPWTVPTASVWSLRRSWQKLKRAGLENPQKVASALQKWRGQVQVAQAKVLERRLCIPPIAYPGDLPVVERLEEIAAVIRTHQVVIICGETGSGKTTQLPKLCLDVSLGLGFGARGLIAHTQPRRIAARTVAQRIAEELNSTVGDLVGYRVRFSERVSPHNFIQLVTDGMLLAEVQRDRYLQQYEVIIIDEAHERSLNIDFLLGYLKQLLPQRPDLKVIITSATLDAERLAQYFSYPDRPAPIIQVSGRLYPVEIRYRPVDAPEDDERDLEEAIVDGVEELCRSGPGDILIFLPGEREIRETATLLQRAITHAANQGGPYHKLRGAEVLPLYARLAVAEQQRIFAPTAGSGRRIILATNVAETSLTVPGIRFVIDTGLARINRYSVRNKVQLLQIEKISQAAANQRSGRCGRVAAGICLRLYEEEDFTARPAYTDPEILRSSLAGVILQMAALGLGEVAQFPFLDAPAPKAVADGYQLLQELGAVDCQNQLTLVGRSLAKLPIDPRLGRILLAAKDEGCLPEILIIVAGLSVPDAREFPLEKQQAAREKHALLADEQSDFLSLLAIWDFFSAAVAQKLSHRKLVDYCRAHFLSYLRLREWRDIHSQLLREVSALGWIVGERDGMVWGGVEAAGGRDEKAAGQDQKNKSGKSSPKVKQGKRAPRDQLEPRFYQAIHRALLSGLLGHIGYKSEQDDFYQGARGIRFALHPASGVNRKGIKWVVVAELVETSRLFGRCVARIEPEWIEAIAGDRVQKNYFDPRWDPARGEVTANERVSLYGLVLDGRRRTGYGHINPVEAHEIFVRDGVVASHLTYMATEQEQQNTDRDDQILRIEERLTGSRMRRDMRSDARTSTSKVESGAEVSSIPSAWPKASFWRHNQSLLEAAQQDVHRWRRQDVGLDEDDLIRGYQQLIPAEINNLVAFEAWRQQVERTYPETLFLTVQRSSVGPDPAGLVLYPPYLAIAGNQYSLQYRFQPGHPNDGVTITVPLAIINQLPGATLDWLVPGLIREKIAFYIKALPKIWRQRLIPVQEYITCFLERQHDQVGRILLSEALRDDLNKQYAAELRTTVALDAWDRLRLSAELPPYLQMNIRVVAGAGKDQAAELAVGRDLAALQERLGQAAQWTLNGHLKTVPAAAIGISKKPPASTLLDKSAKPLDQPLKTSTASSAQGFERTGMLRWECGDLPLEINMNRDGLQMTGYPALVDCGTSVALQLFDTSSAAGQNHAQGVLRLLCLELKDFLRKWEKPPTTFQSIALQLRNLGTADVLFKEFSEAIYYRAFLGSDPVPRSLDSFQKQKERARTRLPAVWDGGLRLLAEIAKEHYMLTQKMNTLPGSLKRFVLELSVARDRLVAKGFFRQTPWEQLHHVPRYLQALQRRLQKYLESPEREQKHSAAVRDWWLRWEQRLAVEQAAGRPLEALQELRWWIEELQVSLFAQELKTPFPISYKRLEKRWSEIIR